MHPFLLSCDWGSSAFRLRLVRPADRRIMAETTSRDGMAVVHDRWKAGGGKDAASREQFALNILQHQIDLLATNSGQPINEIPVVISGMASSSLGIRELPYAGLPFSLDGRDALIQKIGEDHSKRDFLLVSGLRSAADVMRGEETQMIGLGAGENHPGMVRILPGTHSKHILVNNGKITDFSTYMTGEMFNVISENSMLREAVATGTAAAGPAEEKAFDAGVHRALSSNLLHSLFTVRVNRLFALNSREENYHYLSGLLIGTELKDLVEKDPEHIQLCSGSNLFPLYRRGLDIAGLTGKTSFISPETMDQCAVEGHIKIALQYYG